MLKCDRGAAWTTCKLSALTAALLLPTAVTRAGEGSGESSQAAPFRLIEPLRGPASETGDADALPSEPLYLQVVNPADKQREFQESAAERSNPPAGVPVERAPRTSYELPPVQVVGERADSGFRDEDLIGPYNQPRWTARRRFTETRVYVRPPGTAELEYWLRPTVDRGDTEVRSLYEVSIGLGHRLQLDLYLRTDQDGDGGQALLGQQVELRYALADWGVIPGNPTLYVEWVGLEQRPDIFEAKLLLGDQLAPRTFWGANLVAELETGGERTYEYQVTGGVAYDLIDQVLSVGIEGQVIFTDLKGNRGDFDWAYLLGPSLQYRPLPPVHVTLAPLFGLTPDSPDFRAYLVVGYEF